MGTLVMGVTLYIMGQKNLKVDLIRVIGYSGTRKKVGIHSEHCSVVDLVVCGDMPCSYLVVI